MLYVFHVDTGTMMTFDMNLAMESVSNLQICIARQCRISEDKQVLLISGGESLDPRARVGKYSAGTDTNPIFLFSKTTIEAATPPSPSVHYGSDADLQGQVEGSLIMPPAYETVVSRAQLALQFQEVDRDEVRACERLVHDQHLQHQGWAAVVANLEDISSALRQRSQIFQEAYTDYLGFRENYITTLNSVGDSLHLLSKIPVLPCLLEQSLQGVETSRSSSGSSSSSSDSIKNLYDWISSQDPQHSLQDMVDQCIKATEQFDSRILETLMADVESTFEAVNNLSMKEVKGLEDRLYGLDQFMSGARRIVQEQGDMAQGFVQNQNRVTNLRDNSILPDLCSSHKKQLVVMLNNHKKLREIKKKCRLAKEELSVNLHTRLRWVMFVEKKICDVDGKLIIYHENLKRLRKRLDILQQIYDAPKVYAQLVVEVVRRRKFSSEFLQWATSLAEESSHVHKEEVKRRQAFLIELGRHFLQALFPGFDDFPSVFANEAPSPFDQNLPRITTEDISMLREAVPELAEVLSIPSEDVLSTGQALLAAATDRLDFVWTDLEAGRQSDQLQVPRVSSVTTSDIDILQSGEQHLLSMEGGSISLGDQVAECEPDTNICIKDEPSSPNLKPEFPMPKSLSEALTKEMKEQEKRRSRELEDADVDKGEGVIRLPDVTDGQTRTLEVMQDGEKGACAIDGDQQSDDRSGGSSGSSKPHSRKAAGVSDTSPEIETSQEFTTADFYIDESMPSSIADSPPNKSSTEDKRSTSKILEEKSELLEKARTDLQDYQLRLSAAECKIKSLQDIVGVKFPLLRDNLKDIESSFKNDQSDFLNYIEEMKKNILDALCNFDACVRSSNEETLSNLKQEHSHIQQHLEETVKKLNLNLEQIQEKLSIVEGQLSSSKLECEQIRSEADRQRSEVDAEYKMEISELNKQHALELELETDKVREEFQVQLQEGEADVKKKDDQIEALESKVREILKERSKLEETLTEQYQKEKEMITNVLVEEHKENLEKVIKEENEKMEIDHQTRLEEVCKQYDIESQKKLDDLKCTMSSEKDKCVDEVKKEKLEEQKKLIEEKQMLSVEKEDALQKLEEQKKENSDLLQQKIKSEESLTEQYQKEKDTISQLLQDQHKETLELAVKAEQEKADKEHEANMEKARKLYEEDSQKKLEELKTTLTLERDKHVAELCEQQEKLLTDSKQKMSTELGAALQKQMEELQIKHFDQVRQCNEEFNVEKEKLRSELQSYRDREVSTVQMQTSATEEVISMSEHLQRLKEIEEKLASEKQEVIDAALREQQVVHDREFAELVSKLEKEKEDSVSSLKTSMTAEKQVTFNEAMSKVTQEKEKVIEELRQRETALMDQQKKDQESLEQLTKEKISAEEMKDTAQRLLETKERELSGQLRKLEDELSMKNQQLTQVQQQLLGISEIHLESAAPSGMEASVYQYPSMKITELEDTVKARNEKIAELQQRVMEMSMTTSTRTMVQDKVSITSCNVGELVLLCLDDRHDQYVVFTVGTTLHFLHSDCLELLGLRTNPGEHRKSWVLAEITDKEYCQAKKPQNRFKVPVGTKFYRVKAKPWTRESPRRQELSEADDKSPGKREPAGAEARY